MKIWSTLHSDMGSNVNYNGRHSEAVLQTRLYAGNPEYPAVLAPKIGSSDNPSGADNQQETACGILRDCTPGTEAIR
jgi:hypothetical protein